MGSTGMQGSNGHKRSAGKNLIHELSGALGDIGTLLPLSLGAIGVAGLAPVPVLLGFAVFYIATGLYYRLPVPVQPMKAWPRSCLPPRSVPRALSPVAF